MNTVELTAAPPKKAGSGTSTWRDWLGIVASVGCAIHCAAMPFVIAYLPALGLSFLADEAFHKWMALVCFLIAIAAFLPGLKKHRNWWPVSVGGVGLALITFAAFGLAGECCASCNATAASGDQQVVSENGCEHCEECAACAESAAGGSEVAAATTTTQDKGLLSVLAPWITPFGGLMLVGAHLLNRRFGCLCGCC